MPNKPVPIYYWDSCVFLSAVEGDDPVRTPIIEQMLQECDDGKYQIFTSHLSITEVCFAKAERHGKLLDLKTEAEIEKFWDSSSSVKTVEVHELVARDAKGLIRAAIPKGYSLKPADAIHLATAKLWNVAEFHTYDHRLFKFSSVMGFTICHPRCGQLMFPSLRSPLRGLRDEQWH
jgi:predicted nucleic acid-binding protein